MMKSVKTYLERFARDDNGTIGAETMLVLPLLLIAHIWTFVYFDAFHTQNVNLKAAYTISDMLSRQTEEIDEDYLNGLNKVFENLIGNEPSSWLRVTSLRPIPDEDALEVRWSYATHDNPKHTNESIAAVYNKIPIMADGDTVVLVETTLHYKPAYKAKGVAERNFVTFIATRPRFAPEIKFAGMDDGSNNTDLDGSTSTTH